MRAQHLLPLDLGFLQHYLHLHSRVKDQLRQLMERIAGRSDGRLAELGEDSLGGRAALQLACRGVLKRLLRRAERHFNVARCASASCSCRGARARRWRAASWTAR